MISWIKKFLKEVEDLRDDQIRDIKHQKNFHEIVVGMVPTDLKKYKTLLNQEINLFNQEIKDHLKKHNDPNYEGEDCKDFHRLVRNKGRKINILNDIFWLELEESIGYRHKEGYDIGVRHPWTVVEYDEQKHTEEMMEETESMLDQLEKLADLFNLPPGSDN